MILSLLYLSRPEQCRPHHGRSEDAGTLRLRRHPASPHPVVTDPEEGRRRLKWAVREMEDRYRKKMSRLGVRNIDGFNAPRRGRPEERDHVPHRPDRLRPQTGEADLRGGDEPLEPLPYIVVVVDEMADLMMVAGKDIEGASSASPRWRAPPAST